MKAQKIRKRRLNSSSSDEHGMLTNMPEKIPNIQLKSILKGKQIKQKPLTTWNENKMKCLYLALRDC